MTTSGNSISDTEPATHTKPRRLWPWLVSALFLCMLSLGWSLWWPVHQASRLIEFAETHGGSVRVDYNHPNWMSGIVPEKLYIPMYDRMDAYHAPDAPMPVSLLRQLNRFPDIKWLILDISACPHESISVLEDLENLTQVTLTGSDESIPLNWIYEKPDLMLIELNDVPIRPSEWKNALSTSKITGLQTFNYERTILYRYPIVADPIQNYLGIFVEDLTTDEADAMLDLPNLTYLELEYTHADEEFWETLSQSQKIKHLSIYQKGSGSPLSAGVLTCIANIKSLTTLTLVDHPKLSPEENVTPAWQDFLNQRPDVEIEQHDSKQPE